MIDRELTQTEKLILCAQVCGHKAYADERGLVWLVRTEVQSFSLPRTVKVRYSQQWDPTRYDDQAWRLFCVQTKLGIGAIKEELSRAEIHSRDPELAQAMVDRIAHWYNPKRMDNREI